MPKGQFAVAGLGVMGRMVALNIERNGFPVVAYNRGTENADLMRTAAEGKNVQVTQSIEEMVSSLETPRRVLLMVTAGRGTDAVIAELRKLLEPGDVIIDGGNSHFPDTNRRQEELSGTGIHYIGCGISGGEQGALWGPSIMPGGDKEAYAKIEPVLTKIAAKTDDGACVTYVGEGSAGHYVKMVHNGIEYGIMQIICEIYDVFRKSAGMSTAEIQEVFAKWTDSDISGFLVEIAADCLAKQDDLTGKPLVEVILDTAGQKGTGKWTAQSALDLGVPIPTLSMAVTARILSGLKLKRVEASKTLSGPDAKYSGDRDELVASMYNAFYLATVACYAQGMALIRRRPTSLTTKSTSPKWRAFGRAVALFAPGCSNRSRRRSRRIPISTTCCSTRVSVAWRTPIRPTCERLFSWLRKPALPPPVWASRWPTSTATAASSCRRTCCRRCATTSVRTPTNASIAKECSMPSGSSRASEE